MYVCLTWLTLLFAPLAPLPQPSDVGGAEWCLVLSCCLPLCLTPLPLPQPSDVGGAEWCVVMLFVPLSDPPAPPPAQWCGRHRVTACVMLFAPPPALWVGGAEWRLVLSCCLPLPLPLLLPQPCEWEALSDGLCCHAVSGQHGGGEGHLPGSQPEGNSGLHRTDHHHVAAPSSCGISCLWTLGGTCIQAAHFIPFDFTIVNTGHQIQTHKRLKRRLFIRTKHHVRAFRVVPFIKLQNNA